MEPQQPARPRRKKPRPKRRSGEDAKKLARTAQALALRTTGATYRDIAAQLGVTVRTAYMDVQDEPGHLDGVIKEKAERLRELEARRCDRYTLALEPAIAEGDPRAVLAAVRLMERRAKLFGLDAPTTVTGPEGGAVTVRIVHQQLAGG
jgi:hypothetical protein